MKRIATTTMTGLVLLALPVLSGMSLGAFAQEQKYAGTELHIGSVANGPGDPGASITPSSFKSPVLGFNSNLRILSSLETDT